MNRHRTLIPAAVVAVVLAAWATPALAQDNAAGPGRYHTEVVADIYDFWVYTIDTTTGQVWFLADVNPVEWADEGAAPNGPGPVGKYEMATHADENGAHVYVLDTTTGELWVIDAEKGWLPRGAPRP